MRLGFRSFWDNSEGNVALIFALLVVPVIGLGGAGVDLAQYEAARLELQGGLDRGVLAAASLNQSREAEAVVRDYLKPLRYGKDAALSVTEESSANSRKIIASASYTVETAFLHLLGVDSLIVNVSSAAEEAKQNIEISLVLDISGSMLRNNRIGNLKTAAKEFIDQILTDKASEYTTVSIIPYAGQVNVGAAVFDRLSSDRTHMESSCFELGKRNSDYGGNLIDFRRSPQVPHFTHWNYGTNSIQPWWCPLESTSITYLSNDAKALKARIDNLEMHDGTGTQNAMQWGYTLVNPAGKKDVIGAAIAAGRMDKRFANRPAAFDDPDTMKVIVLMTDGAITAQYRPRDDSRSPTLPPDNKQVSSAITNASRLANICTQAKANRVTVFTIGFEVEGQAIDQMRDCATSPSHFYATSGAGISDAFKSISISIKKLKLTQ